MNEWIVLIPLEESCKGAFFISDWTASFKLFNLEKYNLIIYIYNLKNISWKNRFLIKWRLRQIYFSKVFFLDPLFIFFDYYFYYIEYGLCDISWLEEFVQRLWDPSKLQENSKDWLQKKIDPLFWCPRWECTYRGLEAFTLRYWVYLHAS